MKKMILALAGSLLLGSMLMGCGSTEKSTGKTDGSAAVTAKSEEKTEDNVDAQMKTIETDNGTYEVGVLDGWEEIDPVEVNDYADLALENAAKDMYFMILAESEDDYASFDDFLDMNDPSEMVDSVLEEEDQEINTDNWTGTRKIFTGEFDGIKVFYIYDLVASNNGHYAQRIAWTSNSKKAKNEESMLQTIDLVTDVSDE